MSETNTTTRTTDNNDCVKQLCKNISPLTLEAFRNAMQAFVLLALAAGHDNGNSQQKDEPA